MEPIRRFSDEQYDAALESWAWLDPQRLTPRFTSPFGDVFLVSSDGWWFLDLVEGTLSQLWATGEELEAVLNTPDGQAKYLLGGLAAEAEALGVTPSESEVYTFAVPPVLGGSIAVENVSVLDFAVAVDLLGQIHDQVRQLPPGARVTGIDISSDAP
jgi:hypothetical protein